MEVDMSKRSWLSLIVLIFLLSACSAAATPMPGRAISGDNGKSSNETSLAAMPAPAAIQAPVAQSAGNAYATGGDTTDQTQTTTTDRIVIRNASLTIVVPDPVKTLDSLTKMTSDMQGFVVSSNLYKISSDDGTQLPEASITLRIPADKLNDALDTIKKQVKDGNTDVLSEEVTGQDVTKEYTDLQSRLTNLQQAETQLREIMASATKPEDVLNVFNQLTQVREQIEVLQGQIKYYQESAAMSAISVTIKAEASIRPVTIGGWQPVGVARDAVQALVSTLKFLANALIWIVILVLPIGLVLYLVVRLIVWFFRKLRGNRKAKKTVVPPTSIPPAA
jgi:TolA-binding protein